MRYCFSSNRLLIGQNGRVILIKKVFEGDFYPELIMHRKFNIGSFLRKFRTKIENHVSTCSFGPLSNSSNLNQKSLGPYFNKERNRYCIHGFDTVIGRTLNQGNWSMFSHPWPDIKRFFEKKILFPWCLFA